MYTCAKAWILCTICKATCTCDQNSLHLPLCKHQHVRIVSTPATYSLAAPVSYTCRICSTALTFIVAVRLIFIRNGVIWLFFKHSWGALSFFLTEVLLALSSQDFLLVFRKTQRVSVKSKEHGDIVVVFHHSSITPHLEFPTCFMGGHYSLWYWFGCSVHTGQMLHARVKG